VVEFRAWRFKERVAGGGIHAVKSKKATPGKRFGVMRLLKPTPGRA
jgi:hypothetical protein